MFKPLLASTLFALCLTAVAGDDSDAVNERIPVRHIEMEQHWQVDCRAAWGDWQALLARDEAPVTDQNLLHTLKLCSFIYQPPGEPVNEEGPDYAGAAVTLSNNPGPSNP